MSASAKVPTYNTCTQHILYYTHSTDVAEMRNETPWERKVLLLRHVCVCVCVS